MTFSKKTVVKEIVLSILFAGFVVSGQAQVFKKINIEISQGSINELESHPYTNDDEIGNFIVDGERYNDVDIHYRGAYYLKKLIKEGSLRNWKIKTSKEKKFENRREWNFNYEDFIRQNLAYNMYREAGVPCISTENVILSVNGVKQGLYLKYEDPDNKDWLADTFVDDEGDLYKAAYDMPGEEQKFAALTYLGNKDSDYFLHYRKQTNKKNEKEFDYSSIREFLSFINHTTDAEFEAQIEANFDVEGFIRYLVVTNFTANWDAYPVRPKNFFIYNNPHDKKWHFIPWDLDASFQGSHNRNPIGIDGTVFFSFDGVEDYWHHDDEPVDRPIVWRIMKIERYRNKFISEYKKATTSYLSVAHLNEVMDSMQAGVAQNTSGSELRNYRDDVDDVRDFIGKRHAAVLDELDNYDVSVSLTEMIQKIDNGLQIYPNPCSDQLNIFSSKTMEEIRILNSKGQVIMEFSAKSGKASIQTNDLSRGIYFVQTRGSDGVSQQKFIKL